MKLKIVWKGSHGGELDNREIELSKKSAEESGWHVGAAITEMLNNNVVSDGDTLTIEEVRK